jgi:hypothetical protein
MSVMLCLEPLRCGILLLLQAFNAGLIGCEWLDGFDGRYVCDLPKILLATVSTQEQGAWGPL